MVSDSERAEESFCPQVWFFWYFSTSEEGLHGTDKQTFSKTARRVKEVRRIGAIQPVCLCSLVHIQAALYAEGLERRSANG